MAAECKPECLLIPYLCPILALYQWNVESVGWSLDVIVLFLLFGNISTTHCVFIFHFPMIRMNRRLKLCYIKVTCSLIILFSSCSLQFSMSHFKVWFVLVNEIKLGTCSSKTPLNVRTSAPLEPVTATLLRIFYTG